MMIQTCWEHCKYCSPIMRERIRPRKPKQIEGYRKCRNKKLLDSLPSEMKSTYLTFKQDAVCERWEPHATELRRPDDPVGF